MLTNFSRAKFAKYYGPEVIDSERMLEDVPQGPRYETVLEYARRTIRRPFFKSIQVRRYPILTAPISRKIVVKWCEKFSEMLDTRYECVDLHCPKARDLFMLMGNILTCSLHDHVQASLPANISP